MEDLRLATTISLATFALAFVCWFGSLPRESLFQHSALVREVTTIADAEDRAAVEIRELSARLERQLRALDADLDRAVDAVMNATTAKDRDAAKARLDAWRAQKYEIEKRIADLRAAVARTERRTGKAIGTECQANPLVKGCF